MEDMKKKILQYISRSAVDLEITPDTDLFKLGIVHSLFAMQLILFIEKEFDIELDDDDLDFEKIKSINDICNLITENSGS